MCEGAICNDCRHTSRFSSRSADEKKKCEDLLGKNPSESFFSSSLIDHLCVLIWFEKEREE